jgi:hypothetical protein
MRNSTNIFLINLSVADLLVLLICTPTVLVEVNTAPETWVLGERMCKFQTLLRIRFVFLASSRNIHMRSLLGFIHIFMSFLRRFRWFDSKPIGYQSRETDRISHLLLYLHCETWKTLWICFIEMLMHFNVTFLSFSLSFLIAQVNWFHSSSLPLLMLPS